MTCRRTADREQGGRGGLGAFMLTQRACAGKAHCTPGVSQTALGKLSNKLPAGAHSSDCTLRGSSPRNANKPDSPPGGKQAYQCEDDPRDQIVHGKVIGVVYRPHGSKLRDVTIPELGRDAGPSRYRVLRWFAVGGKCCCEVAAGQAAEHKVDRKLLLTRAPCHCCRPGVDAVFGGESVGR